MKRMEIYIADKNGKEKERKVVYPVENREVLNKKQPIIDEEKLLHHLTEARKIYKEMAVGQREAEVKVEPDKPDMPIFIWLLCDSHLGSVLTDYDAFLRDYNIVRETPNFYVISNGDEIDNFMVTLGPAATGVYENPITPEQQAMLIRKLFKKLDEQGKLLAMSFGNHNDWVKRGGYEFENTWLADLKAPILNCGGLLKLKVGRQEYKLALTHRYWGYSKLNPTNMAKRFMEHEFPSADVIFLGHTHQAEFLFFRRDQERRDQETDYKYAIIGGTYKVDDEWSLKHGTGSPKRGGFVLKLDPKKRNIEVLHNVPEAREYFFLLEEIKSEGKRKANKNRDRS